VLRDPDLEHVAVAESFYQLEFSLAGSLSGRQVSGFELVIFQILAAEANPEPASAKFRVGGHASDHSRFAVR
jgi:hypothetical protein